MWWERGSGVMVSKGERGGRLLKNEKVGLTVERERVVGVNEVMKVWGWRLRGFRFEAQEREGGC